MQGNTGKSLWSWERARSTAQAYPLEARSSHSVPNMGPTGATQHCNRTVIRLLAHEGARKGTAPAKPERFQATLLMVWLRDPASLCHCPLGS